MKDNIAVEFAPQGVSEEFMEAQGVAFEYILEENAHELLLPRSGRANKHTYGHALLVCGSREMPGAAVLAAGGALRSGCGLVTAHIPQDERLALTANYPSAMVSLDPAGYFSVAPQNLNKYAAIGIGCGLGQAPETVSAFAALLKECRTSGRQRLVIDADGLNILANDRSLLEYLPAETILTPHEGELKRLTGEWGSEEEKIVLVREFASKHNLIVVVKGPNTMICVKGERLLFNSTGNSGMAKGGSGDVLTGFVTGLLARGYTPTNAAILGVFLHGLAGDKARDYFGAEGMNSADIIDFLAEAILDIE